MPDRGGGGGGRGSGKKEEGGGGGEGGAAKDEIASIQENAQKAADAVKPWWQKALAVVVSIVVAVVVSIVVTALIVTTGPVGAVDISKWFEKEIGVVQSPVGQLRVILGTEDGVLKRQIAPGETFIVHTHPVTVTHKNHFGTDLKNAGKHIEAVIDGSGQITYFTKQDPVRGTGGVLNPTRPDGIVEAMHDYQAAFMDAVGNIVGFARIDVIEGPQGIRIIVRE